MYVSFSIGLLISSNNCFKIEFELFENFRRSFKGKVGKGNSLTHVFVYIALLLNMHFHPGKSTEVKFTNSPVCCFPNCLLSWIFWFAICNITFYLLSYHRIIQTRF